LFELIKNVDQHRYLPRIPAQEADFAGGMEDEVNLILRELSLKNIFLKNSEEKRNEHEVVKELVSH
jgi:hypothetical protein